MQISVIIPAYNAERTIGKCLDSLAASRVRPCEVIVVDDGSTDRTAAVVRAFPFVTFLTNSRGKGAGGARNTGGLAARGDVLAFTDSDCVVPEGWLAGILEALADETVAGVAGGYAGHVGNSLIGRFAFAELAVRRKGMPDYVETAVTNNFAVRASLFREIGGFPELFSGATAEDMIFSFHVSRRGKIRWLTGNGVLHHFNETLRGYLRQQNAFARDTVVTFRWFPELRTARTHHGLLLYAVTAATIAGLATLPLSWQGGVAAFAAAVAMDASVVREVGRQSGLRGMSHALFVLPLRNVSNVAGILQGVLSLTARNAAAGSGSRASAPLP